MAPVVTDPKRASLALKKIVVEMEKRYELFSKSGTRNIEGYNNLMKDNLPAVLPYIVVIVDELADLMMVATNDVEDAITRLAQMARRGIHLIIATRVHQSTLLPGSLKRTFRRALPLVCHRRLIPGRFWTWRGGEALAAEICCLCRWAPPSRSASRVLS